MEFLNVMGRGYVIDHCISSFQKEQEEKVFRIYLTDALQAIAENTQRFAGGMKMNKRYYDIINIKPQKQEETADEIILRLKGRINGSV